MTEIKETKSQRLERLKREKNPWEGVGDIRAFAREGRESVLPEWASSYFKWWGIYTQGDGIGAIGGKGGEGKATEYFMMRIGLPNGILTSRQMRVIGDIAARHGRDVIDITVRQNIQLHWLTIQAIPEIIETLKANGLSSMGACGDVVRNVTGCPLAGLAADELLDASPFALQAARELVGNSEFYNLPRKFKISITGCPSWCCYPEINDIGLTPAIRMAGNQREVGFSVRVGGGLSSEPHLAVRLNAFVRQDQVMPVLRKITELFRDQQVLRQAREKARMKYLFVKEGWTAETFLAELESRLGYKLDPAVEESIPEDILRDHVGIHAQRQEGLCYVGLSVLRGRMTAAQACAVADLADRYGNGELRATIMQNLVVVNVPKEKAHELAQNLESLGLPVQGSSFARGGIACTGTEYCKLAITETKGFLRWVVDELEERLPAFDQQIRLHITGCPNGCGQHWIADIGMEGKKIKHDGKLVDAYNFLVGGSVGLHQHTARPLGYRCLASEVPDAVERLLRGYLETRRSGENLRAYFSRTGDEEIRNLLSGPVLVPALQETPQHAKIDWEWPVNLFPLFLKLDGKRSLVVGAGVIGQEKIEALLRCGSSVCVVAPEATAAIQGLSQDGKIEWHRRLFSPELLEGSQLVVAATNDREVNRRVFEEAAARSILCNTADDPPLCDFFFGSIVRRGDLQIAISTAGKSPALAQRLKEQIDAMLNGDTGRWLDDLGELRIELLRSMPAGEDRKRLLHELAQREVCGAGFCPTRLYAAEVAVAATHAEPKDGAGGNSR